MVTRYNPRLLLRIGGVLVATADPAVGAPAPLVAVDKASVTWGRTRSWDHQSSAQATVSIIDRAFTYGPHLGVQLAGAPVTLSYDVPGVLAERIFFRGNVTDYDGKILPPDRDGNNRGMRIDVTAASIVTTLANIKTGVFVQSAGQLFGLRWGQLQNFMAPAFVADTVYDVQNTTESWWNRPLAARTYNNESALDAQRQLLDMTSDRQIYDPHTNVLTFSPRRRLQDSRGYAVPVSSTAAGGLVLKAPGWESAPTLDAAEFTGGKLTKNADARVTAIRATGWTDSSGTTQSSGSAVLPDPVMDQIAPIPFTIATDWYVGTDTSNTLNRWNGVIAREAKSWRPEPITHQTKLMGGIPLDVIPVLLNGNDYDGVIYFGRSDWARAGVVPAWAVIGGTISYEGGDPGWWSPAVQLAAPAYYDVSGSLSNARTPANVDVGAAHPLKAADLSSLVSAADAQYWTTAYTG